MKKSHLRTTANGSKNKTLTTLIIAWLRWAVKEREKLISKETCKEIAKIAETTIIFQKSGFQSIAFVNGSAMDITSGIAIIAAHIFNVPEGKQ